MLLGPVLGQGGVTARCRTAGVSRDAATFEEDLDGGGREADFDLLVDAAVGNAVVVAVDLDVVVDVDARLLPLGEDEGFGRQRLEPRPLQLLKQPGPRGVELAKLPLVEVAEQFPDGQVQLGQGVEGAFPQGCQDPALDDQNGRLDLRLIAGFSDASRKDYRGIVVSQITIRWVQVRLVIAGIFDGGFPVVGILWRSSLCARTMKNPYRCKCSP